MLIEQAGLNAKELLVAIETDQIKMQLKHNTEQAINLGVFGVPTFICENELFFGHDRLDQMESFLQNNCVLNEAFFKEALARKASANRT
jgi:2-hydroxychromene-2-carboxylate isomerase